MNLRNISIPIVLALALPGSLSAIQITGKVTSTDGDIATIAMDGDVLPSVGNKIEIYFKMGHAEISVGSGQVTEATTGSVKARIDNATGTVAKDQLARIELGSGSHAKKASPAVAPAGAKSSLGGDWIGSMTGNTRISFSFKDNNSLLWVVESPGSTTSTRAKYRLDTTVTPHVIEIFDFEEGEMKGEKLRGIFEMQSDDRLKLDVSEKSEAAFTAETVMFSRAASPIVRPPSTSSPPKDGVAVATSPSPPATSTAPVDPTPDPSKPPDEQQIAIGDARYTRRDFDGAIEAYKEAIKLNPKNSWGYRDRGAALVQKDDPAGAIADYEQAIKLDPKRWKGSLGESIKDLKEMAKRNPK